MPQNNTIKLPVDSKVSVTVVSNGSEAYVTAEPPVNGGAEITAEAIVRQLAESGVTYGIIEDAVNKIADKKLYGDRTLIAMWKPPVNGVDGTITYHYEKKVEIAPVENEHGFVDYKKPRSRKDGTQRYCYCGYHFAHGGRTWHRRPRKSAEAGRWQKSRLHGRNQYRAYGGRHSNYCVH